jgi:hypothetical protein
MTDHAIYKQGVTEDGTPMIRRSIKKLLHAKKKDVAEAEGYSDYYPGGKTPGLTTDVLNTILTKIAKRGLDDKEDEEDRPKNRFRTPKKKETKEQDEVTEKWSEKYKKSIDCSNPKGFSQKAHCDGRKKKETKEATGSGSSGAYSGPVFGGDDAFWERSRSENPKLKESDVEKVEAKEATTSGSVGGYESPSMWAKSTKKKDWGPSRKPQIPGGGFVKVKKKCTKFPYCNQGDINAITITKNESVQDAIKNVSKKMKISEDRIKKILEQEMVKLNKRTK